MDFLVQFIIEYGLFGLFGAAVFLNASVLLPLPFDLIFVAVAGLGIYNPLLLGLAAGSGAAIGEMVGYALGFWGSKTIEKMSSGQMQRIYDFKQRIKDLGTIFVIIGAFIPFPFDLIGVAAGLVKFSWKRFLIGVWIGRTLRYVLVATAIFYGVEAIKGFFVALV
ncbi:MAG: VTT domain-containing protein [Candidatus Diapherotrites archaeon]|nr:VTT domain-containing protein [Candidatus Diapherotrites archaeon]